MPIFPPLPDWLPVLVALTILAARSGWLLMRGEESRQVLEVRRAWVARVLAAPGLEILAVQTLRNSIMAASLMATTAALGLMGVISIGYAYAGSELKLFLPLGLLAACVVLFSKSVRLYHRAGYSLGLAERTGEQQGEAKAAAVSELTRAGRLYRAGWHSFYAAVATGAWLVSAWMMLVTTIIIVTIDIVALAE